MSSDTNGFRVSENEPNGLQVNHSNPLANRPLSANSSKPSVEEVDRLADKLAAEFNNLEYRQWYCRVIYDFGISRVLYWHKRATSDGVHEPSRLFGYYVKQARVAPLTDDSTHADTGIEPIANLDTSPQSNDVFDRRPTLDDVSEIFLDDEAIPV